MVTHTYQLHSVRVKNFLHNLVLLELVTLLLSLAAPSTSGIQLARSSAVKMQPAAAGTGLLNTLNMTFVDPYVYAWKKMAPHTNTWTKAVLNLPAYNPLQPSKASSFSKAQYGLGSL